MLNTCSRKNFQFYFFNKMSDSWRCISKYIPNGSWKNFVFSCREFYKLNTDYEVDRRSNHLGTLYKLNIFKLCIKRGIPSIEGRKITVDMLLDNYDILNWDYLHKTGLNISLLNEFKPVDRSKNKYSWNWDYVSKNPTLSTEFMREYIYFLNLKDLSKNPNLTWDIINKRIDGQWDWNELSQNKAITLDIFTNNIDAKWRWDYVSRNPNITWDFIKQNPTKKFNWGYVCRYINMNFNHIEELKKLNWNTLSLNKNITWDFINNNPDKPWNWKLLSRKNPSIETVRMNSDKPWDYKILVNTLWEIAKKTPDRANWYIISSTIATWDMVKNNPDKPWNWVGLTINPNITLDIIEKNMDKGWVWEYALANPNMTWRFAKKYPRLRRVID